MARPARTATAVTATELNLAMGQVIRGNHQGLIGEPSPQRPAMGSGADEETMDDTEAPELGGELLVLPQQLVIPSDVEPDVGAVRPQDRSRCAHREHGA